MLLVFSSAAIAQTSSFTYQGKLTDGGSPANGTYDLTFRLFNAATDGSQVGTDQVKDDVTVSNGVFTVVLNFGAAAFAPGGATHLEISVRSGSSTGSYTLLTPRQPITSSPYAIQSINFSGALGGDVSGGQSTSTVSGLQNRAVASTAPTSGQVLTWNGGSSQWEPGTPSSGTPGPGSTHYIQNGTSQQPGSNFNISNDGVVGGNFTVVGTITGSGAGVTNLNPANISPGTAPINIAGSAAKSMNVTSGDSPSVAGLTTLVLEYPTPSSVSNLTNGTVGQCVTLIVAGQQITIGSSGNFRLTDNWFGQINDALTVCRHVTNGVEVWIEQSRSNNAPSVQMLVGGGPNGTIYVGTDSFFSCTGSCSVQPPPRIGTRKMLTAIPNPGYVFTGWTGGGCSGTDPCFLLITEATSIGATFTRQSYDVTVTKSGSATGTVTSVPGNINCGATCTTTLPGDSVVQLLVAPGPNAYLAGWTGPPGCTLPSCVFQLTSNSVATVKFDLIPRDLTIIKNGTGGSLGSVTSNPTGINCGFQCTWNFPHGSLVQLTAVPGSNNNFVGWSDPSCPGNSPTCTVTMDTSRTLTATFTLDQFPLTIEKQGTGAGYVGGPASIDCGPTCTAMFDYNTVVNLRADAANGSVFAGWSGDCAGSGTTCQVTMSSARYVYAIFDTAGLAAGGKRP
jgi:hypothetical protein